MHTLATMDIDLDNLDISKIVTNGPINHIIRFNDRNDIIDINNKLTQAYFEDHSGEITVTIKQNSYTFTQNVWQAILSVTDQWLERFLTETNPDMFTTKQNNVVSLFG